LKCVPDHRPKDIAVEQVVLRFEVAYDRDRGWIGKPPFPDRHVGFNAEGWKKPCVAAGNGP